MSAFRNVSMSAIVAACFVAGPAQAQQSVEAFYKTKTLTILLGHPPGGSYDFYARLATDFLKKYVPGHPNVLVEYRPGGGGVIAAGFFYAQSPRDGSVISLFPETIAHTQVLDPEVGKWKLQEMTYIGSFAPVNTGFAIRKDSPARTPAEMRKITTVVGCSGVNSQSFQYPQMLKTLGGFQFKMICGYPGSAEYVLALHKGEVDLVSSAWNNLRVTNLEDFKSGEFIAVIQGGLRRNAELANVPLMQELVEDPEAKKIIEFASAGAGIGRALLAPPKVPEDRIAALRAAFDQMVKDPEFLSTAKTRGLEIEPTPGEAVQRIAEAIIKAPADLIEKASKAQAQ